MLAKTSTYRYFPAQPYESSISGTGQDTPLNMDHTYIVSKFINCDRSAVSIAHRYLSQMIMFHEQNSSCCSSCSGWFDTHSATCDHLWSPCKIIIYWTEWCNQLRLVRSANLPRDIRVYAPLCIRRMDAHNALESQDRVSHHCKHPRPSSGHQSHFHQKRLVFTIACIWQTHPWGSDWYKICVHLSARTSRCLEHTSERDVTH